MNLQFSNLLVAVVGGLILYPFILWMCSGFLMGPGFVRSLKRCFMITGALSVITVLAAIALVAIIAVAVEGGRGWLRLLLLVPVGWYVGCHTFIGHVFERDDPNELGIIALFGAMQYGVWHLVKFLA